MATLSHDLGVSVGSYKGYIKDSSKFIYRETTTTATSQSSEGSSLSCKKPLLPTPKTYICFYNGVELPRFTYNGKLEVIMGGMYSGKTTELERRARRYAIANKSVIVVKPKKDTRYSKDEVVSHDKIKLRAIPCDKMGDIIDTLISADVICIDEGQFISDVVEVSDLLCNIGKRVIVDMLHATFDRVPFPAGDPMLLLSMADDVSFLTAVCVQCGGDASNSMLVNKKDILPSLTNKDSIIIEGTDTKKDQGRYEARCRRCFMMS